LHILSVSVALVIQREMHTRRFILSSVTCLVLQYFPTLSHKRRDFREKVIEHKMCVFIFSASVSEAFLIITKTELSIVMSYIRLLVKHRLVLSDFNET
jgi:hypothetical protein